VRDHLIAFYYDLRRTYADQAHRDGDGVLERYVLASLSPTIDALLDGRQFSFARYLLPDDHPMAPPHGGHPADQLVLGSDDVVVEHTPHPVEPSPDRAKFREALDRREREALERERRMR
jgi:hypothetical protein